MENITPTPSLSDEIASLRKLNASMRDLLKRCCSFLGETIQCNVDGEMLDGSHVNVAASNLADDIDDLLKEFPANPECPTNCLTFGQAIEAMKHGKKVARRGWNGKGMWLCIPLLDGPKEIPATGIWGKPNADYAKQNGGSVKVLPYITMKSADGSIVMGWLPSQTDMLSDDWCIVE